MARIAILGAGATGKALYFLLSRKNETLLISRRSHLRELRKGVHISGAFTDTIRPDVVPFPPSRTALHSVDYLFIAVKAYDTASAAAGLRGRIEQGTAVVSLQNGFDNYSAIRRNLGNSILSGTTTLAVTPLSFTEIKVATTGTTYLGSIDGNASLARSAVRLLRDCGMNAKFTSDPLREIWLKGVANCCINPLTALLGKENGCIHSEHGLRQIATMVCMEASGVAAAMGMKLSPEAMFRRVMHVARETAANRSSMLRDMEQHRKTEISELNGYIVRQASKFRIPVPVNRLLYELIMSREKEFI